MQDNAKTNSIAPNLNPRGYPWQVPVFVIGFLAFAIALWFRLSTPTSASDSLSRNLASIIENSQEQPPKKLETQLRKILEASTQYPDLNARARFHLTSLLLRESPEKPESFSEPAKLLENLDPTLLTQKELRQFPVLRAKLNILSGKQIPEALEALDNSLPGAEDPSEVLEWIARGSLKLPEPDLAKALKANEEYRNIPLLAEEKRIPAQLLGGEILMQLQRHEEARKVLENIQSSSNPELEIRAKFLLAESYEKEKHWLEAVNVWKQTLEAPPDVNADPGKALYHLAYCLSKIDLPREAEQFWRECEEKSVSDEKTAASVQLANLYLEQKSLKNLSLQLTTATRNTPTLKEWKNKYFTLIQIQELLDKAEKFAIQEQDFDEALKINDASQRVLTAYKGLSNRSEIMNAWALNLDMEAKAATDPAKGKSLLKKAEKAYKDSAALHLKAAAESDNPTGKANQLWQSAASYKLAKDPAKSLEALVQFINQSPQDNRLGTAWYLLGDVQKELGKPDAARDSYLQSMKYRGPYSYRSRYQIALLMMEKNEYDQAADILEQNLQLLRFDPDQEAQERSLFALGSLFFQRRNYRMVVRRYEEALDKFSSNQQAIRAKLQLAESYRQLANQEQQNLILNEKTTTETKTHYQNEHRKWLTRASETYQELEQVCDSPLGITQLTVEERKLAPLLAAECKFNLGNYESALILYSRQYQKNKGSKDALHSLGGMIRCHSALGQQELVQTRLAELRSQLSDMDEPTRKEWDPWLALASKPIQKP